MWLDDSKNWALVSVDDILLLVDDFVTMGNGRSVRSGTPSTVSVKIRKMLVMFVFLATDSIEII